MPTSRLGAGGMERAAHGLPDRYPHVERRDERRRVGRLHAERAHDRAVIDGQGSTTMSDIGSSSPTTRLDSVSEEPAAQTKSMRSNTSHGEMPGWPDVHVKPGFVTASGCASRNESRNPAFSITTEVGQRIENRGARYRSVVGCQPSAFTTRGVQSRHDGALKLLRERARDLAGGELWRERIEERLHPPDPDMAFDLQPTLASSPYPTASG